MVLSTLISLHLPRPALLKAELKKQSFDGRSLAQISDMVMNSEWKTLHRARAYKQGT